MCSHVRGGDRGRQPEDDGDGFGVGVGLLHGEGVDRVLVEEARVGVVHGVETELVEEVLVHVGLTAGRVLRAGC